MKAIHLTAYGSPAQNLRMVEIPEPNAPSAGEALVRIEYAPVDYSDLLLANGVYFLKPQPPSVIGGEGAWIVEAIGPGSPASRWETGLRSRFEHSLGLRKSLLRSTVFSSFLLQSTPRQPRC
jgi:NADPH:quinone reductase-like Zn-dependent oxidoreductase